MKFRVARHCRNLAPLIKFYTEVMGLENLGGFEKHEGYDGVFLGIPDKDWHIEFTVSDELPAHHADEDDALVFYPENTQTYLSILSKIDKNEIQIEPAKNPYWNRNAVSVKDPEGFYVIVVNPDGPNI